MSKRFFDENPGVVNVGVSTFLQQLEGKDIHHPA